jgi:hypothetical protein
VARAALSGYAISPWDTWRPRELWRLSASQGGWTAGASGIWYVHGGMDPMGQRASAAVVAAPSASSRAVADARFPLDTRLCSAGHRACCRLHVNLFTWVQYPADLTHFLFVTRSLLTYLLTCDRPRKVPLLLTGVRTNNHPPGRERQEPLPMFRCPGLPDFGGASRASAAEGGGALW